MQRNNIAFKKNDVAIASHIVYTKMKDTQDTLGKKKSGVQEKMYIIMTCVFKKC